MVTTSGELQPALASGNALNISRFLIAPNNKLYVLFLNKVVDLETGEEAEPGGDGCLLAEVNPTSGVPTCVESEVDQILWENFGMYSSLYNSPIQFDADGAIYYLAHSYAGGVQTVLRKYLNGETVDLINDNISINNFKVMDDGSVFLSGHNGTNYAKWLRRLSNQNSLENILANTSEASRFLYLFPDKKLYFGFDSWQDGYRGVFSIDTSSSVIDETALITDSVTGKASTYTCDGWDYNYGCGSNPSILITTTSDKVFGIIGLSPRKRILQFYPEVRMPTVSIDKVAVAAGVLDDIVFAGVDAEQKNRLFIYNTSSDQEYDLMPDDDIEIYRLNYVESQNKLMFDGLRLSDNQYVIGWYDFNSGQLSVTPTGDIKLVDFQTFD